jgi:hypothetical protein
MKPPIVPAQLLTGRTRADTAALAAEAFQDGYGLITAPDDARYNLSGITVYPAYRPDAPGIELGERVCAELDDEHGNMPGSRLADLLRAAESERLAKRAPRPRVDHSGDEIIVPQHTGSTR